MLQCAASPRIRAGVAANPGTGGLWIVSDPKGLRIRGRRGAPVPAEPFGAVKRHVGKPAGLRVYHSGSPAEGITKNGCMEKTGLFSASFSQNTGIGRFPMHK